jgi:peptidyl-prolyl cis-trans isomerase C
MPTAPGKCLAVSLAGALACALWTGCASDSPGQPGSAAYGSEAVPLATVGEVVITTADVERRLADLSPYDRARYTSLEHRRELLDNMIRFEVLAQEALRRGFDEHPDVVRTVKELMIQQMMDERLAELDPSAIPIEELRAFYETRAEEFHRPEEVRASVIVVADEGRARALTAQAQAASPRGFRELVEAHSVDAPTRARGGDLRYFTRDTDELPAVIVEAAFAAEAGEVVGPIAESAGGEGAYYIVKRTGYRPAIEHDFEDVIPQIRNRVYRQQRADAQAQFIDDLRRQAAIEVREDAIEAIDISSSGSVSRSADSGGPADAARRPPPR